MKRKPKKLIGSYLVCGDRLLKILGVTGRWGDPANRDDVILPRNKTLSTSVCCRGEDVLADGKTRRRPIGERRDGILLSDYWSMYARYQDVEETLEAARSRALAVHDKRVEGARRDLEAAERERSIFLQKAERRGDIPEGGAA
jgi:hypothetical protein